jgi:hypothetical protein
MEINYTDLTGKDTDYPVLERGQTADTKFNSVGNTCLKITSLLAVGLLAGAMSASVYAKGGVGGGGGTAKPPAPKTAVGPFSLLSLAVPASVTANAANIHQFDDTGFIQNAKVWSQPEALANCPGEVTPIAHPEHWGGTVTMNNITITIPCNLIVQMPANTLTWSDFVNGGRTSGLELDLVGNIVSGQHIAGLAYTSEQSLNTTTGVISKIDYSNGNIEVDTGNPAKPIVIQINDPNGRFGRVRSPDFRFSVDDENPTIHAATGYPMCVPRNDPNDPNPANRNDPLCPQKNRPLTVSGCRNFSQALAGSGLPLPVSGELSAPVAGQTYCSQFVMKSLTDPSRVATDPTPDQQAPFEVGDFITFSGTFINGTFSVHTIEANVGIYTQPGSKPSYVAIGEFGVGTNDPVAAVTGVGQENTNRIFLEAETTDVKTPVDIYMVDVDANGVEKNRWITPFEMTGECDPAAPFAASCLGLSGGITTQNTGPQPQRARIRAAKSVNGMLVQPSRYIRVMARSLCKPNINDANFTTTGHSSTLDSCIANIPAVANGILAGQYFAPVFEYIFPENVKPGDVVVPNDMWQLPFLVNGDGDVGNLSPTPW